MSQQDKERINNLIIKDFLTGKYTTIELGNKHCKNHSTVSQILTEYFKRTSRIYGASDSR